LAGLPDGEALCHGELHPGNVIRTAEGPRVVDWFDASRGDAAADVANTSLVIRHAALPGGLDPRVATTLAAVREAFGAAYLDHYARLCPAVAARVAAWLLPVAVARLALPLPAGERETLTALVSHL
jgi:aminoglycoside phosphotransferase (APT) family kinase protein